VYTCDFFFFMQKQNNLKSGTFKGPICKKSGAVA
jgi:hypothetical protein